MDLSQTNHLKAYGVVFWNLKQGNEVDWLLNFKGGSFLMESTDSIKNECIIRGVQFKNISVNEYSQILSLISENNMDIALLETVPKIAVYSPPGKQPWDDAVTLALTYAEVEYDVIFDEEVLNGGLAKYDWLHLHHEDFTGQYGKFYKNYRNKAWYKNMESEFNLTASKFGFNSVHNLKKNIASIIKNYVQKGGFLFAMCSATDSFDIALSALDCDIAHSVFDGTPIDHNCKNKLNYDNTFAFEKFELITDPLTYEYSNIDIVKTICKIYDELNGSKDSDKLISFVEDRKGHDYRYALNSSKIIKSGWNCKMNFKDSIKNIIMWYLKNKSFLN